jgi:hypothetical protein
MFIRGLIDRRILINYRVQPEALRRVLPEPFRPKLVDGVGVAGVCLIRLVQVRPQFAIPAWLGLGSENAAHRIAVEWDDAGQSREGVYIPRRDTSSHFNRLIGGRLFPGYHHHARFDVQEYDGRYKINIDSDDRLTHLAIDTRQCDAFSSSSVFRSLDEASEFFRRGAIGYSVTPSAGVFDCLELKSLSWSVEPLEVAHVESSFFDDRQRFPRGTVEFDSALLMRRIAHQWHAHERLVA